MSDEQTGAEMPHAWVENILLDVILYCKVNGLGRVAEALGPALVAANALSLPHPSRAATHEGAPNTTQ